MHMWMWFGYDLGEFMFAGLQISTRWAFALTWIVLFFVALMFEGSKVYLARVQREAQQRLYPFRSDERRNLLCDRDREQGMEPTTSRNASTGQVEKWTSLKIRVLVNTHQSSVFVIHNLVGYLLMLAVMVYNVQLLLAVVSGMMIGYFLFGPKLTQLQMQCFGNRRVVICTPECDDTAESSTPPLLGSAQSSESDFFICQTRTCIQPSHYFRASTSQDGGTSEMNATCFYGAKQCPSKVARAKKLQTAPKSHCSHKKSDSPEVEDAQLLKTRQSCCKKKQEPPPESSCCKTSQEIVIVHETEQSSCCKDDTLEREETEREHSPQVTCCHTKKSTPSESQEQIIK